jgi:hypothetical protein
MRRRSASVGNFSHPVRRSLIRPRCIDGSSYRLKEATERAATKAKTRAARRKA